MKILLEKKSIRFYLKILMMKIVLAFLFIAMVQADTPLLGQEINLNLKNSNIEHALLKVSRQAQLDLVYDSKLLSKGKSVSIRLRNATVTHALNKILENQPFSYEIRKKTLVIKPYFGIQSDLSVDDELPTIIPSRVITGKVTDGQRNPLSSVSVTAKGSTAGTTTDAKGNYSISVADDVSVLIFSMVGYKSMEVNIRGRDVVDVSMEMQTSDLDEVVVVGYGTQLQKDVTGSVAAISDKELNQGMVLSPQESIQGKLSGVNISQNSGKPGGSNTIRIRGGTSLTQSNDPLYVIDGVPISNSAGIKQANINAYSTNIFDMEPTNPLMTINPDDIESITVLKDASASAIYGARAANGVIVITTKKGIAGDPKIAIGASLAASKVSNKLDVLSADEYRNEIDKLGLTIDDKGGNTDWQDEIYRTGLSQDYNMSISGGGEKTTYRASIGYGDMEGVMIGSNLNRADLRINIGHSMLNDRLSFDLRTTYGQTSSSQAPISNRVGSEFASSMNYEALVFNPTYPVFDPDGNFYNVRPFRVNPVSFSEQVFDEVVNNRFLGNLTTTLKIIDPLKLNVNLGYTDQNINRDSYISKANLLGEGTSGYASVQKLEDYSKLLEVTLNYENKFGNHFINALGGYSWQYFLNSGLRNQASGFLSDAFKWYSLQAASTVNEISTFQESNTLISFYGRLNYSYLDKILFTGTVRKDGSSRFGSGNKWGLFPSGSVAWRLSQEDFFNVKAINDLKFRLSYGTTGNQEIGNLNSIQTLGATNSGYIVGGSRITTVLPQQYANPALKWEQTAQVDFGLDFSLLNYRISGTIDFYNKKTTDLLLRIPVPTPTAVNSQLANVGSVRNRGVEVSINGKIVERDNFSWNSSFNISFNRNKVLSLSNDQFKGDNIQLAPLQGTVSLGKYAQLVIPGQPLGTFWGPKLLGIKDGQEELAYGGKDTIIGLAQPKYIWGFTNTFAYKKWTLNFLLRGSVGNDVFNLTAANMSYLSNLPGRNVLKSALEAGVDYDAPKQYSSRWIEDGSFLRLDNLTLSYDLDLGRFFSRSVAKVFFSGQNLFIITNYSGLDPEVNSEVSGSGSAPLGVDYLSYPKARTFTFGFSVSF